MEQLDLPTLASSASVDSTPAELSIVIPTVRDGRDGFWVVENGGIMTPINPNLESRNMSRSYELPDGTEALVPTNSESYVRFIKTHHCWKRIRLGGGGVELVVDRNRGVIEEPGFGDFLEAQQLPERPKDGRGDWSQAAPPSLSLRIPVSIAKDGLFKGCDLPAFRADLERDLQLSIFLKASATLTRASQSPAYPPDRVQVVCDPDLEAFMVHSILIDAYVEGKSITRGQLARHAATVVIEMMQVTQGHLQPTIAVRNF
ncbi:hypothetical protein V8D89_003030 [Ganoderma adspersum]